MPELPPRPLPKVLIVGAGLAGLLHAMLLERANIPYEIFERASTVKPLGAVMSLNANILPVFEQLGLYEDLLKISFPILATDMYQDTMEHIAVVKVDDVKDIIGYDYVVFARPLLYDLVLSKIPKEKIHFNKKVVQATSDADKVTIECQDGSEYEGDLLVGADGAYSVVREYMYKDMAQKGILPAIDSDQMDKGYVCLVGTSDPLDAEKYPALKDDFAHFAQIMGTGSPYSWSTISVPNQKICWNVVAELAATDRHEDSLLKNAEWGPEANEKMIKEVYNFKTPFGGIMGDLIDATPRERISKVFLEEKLFQTWHHGRMVLIGDACHKMLPSAGQGAVNAMQDSVVLANALYDLHSLSVKDISAAFEDYRLQRVPHVKYQFDVSKSQARIIYGQTLFSRVMRHVVFNYLPKSVQTKNIAKGAGYRPQATFLPLAPTRGSSEVLPQRPSRRYTEEQEHAQNKAATV
ncbi:hypothetical protein BGW38_001482 [Lunasporangiospora selenospora]|uniref:FAD-binding domain-containing protein n=1 Tax=Lunasporangiospora selenospora TaxID=979761 RepID=A0A9P6FVJ3_9FUNG|nr:hypothetical protein BGW38_001482 [Lunasporangiospora selenospora]